MQLSVEIVKTQRAHIAGQLLGGRDDHGLQDADARAGYIPASVVGLELHVALISITASPHHILWYYPEGLERGTLQGANAPDQRT